MSEQSQRKGWFCEAPNTREAFIVGGGSASSQCLSRLRFLKGKIQRAYRLQSKSKEPVDVGVALLSHCLTSGCPSGRWRNPTQHGPHTKRKSSAGGDPWEQGCRSFRNPKAFCYITTLKSVTQVFLYLQNLYLARHGDWSDSHHRCQRPHCICSPDLTLCFSSVSKAKLS